MSEAPISASAAVAGNVGAERGNRVFLAVTNDVKHVFGVVVQLDAVPIPAGAE